MGKGHDSVEGRVAVAVEAFRRRPRLLALRCGVQHYDWGGLDYIPGLLGIENRNRKPFAELWVGAHPDLPSTATIGGTDVTLNVLIEGAAAQLLGEEVARRFGPRLPFLMKVLSSRKPLSIQAHPSKQQAWEGFARENQAGIGPRDPVRNYHDDNHKPELISALTDFYALRGFKPLGELATTLEAVPELRTLSAGFEPTRESLRALYSRVMGMSQQEVDAMLVPLVERLKGEHGRRPFGPEDVAYWVLEADRDFSADGHRDRGIFSMYILNLVHLYPGQAMYLPAGELHAYLQGTGVEIMANSNNVLRGGLTPKHVDVDELLGILTFTSAAPEVLTPTVQGPDAGVAVYNTPAEEFVLSRLRLTRDHPHRRGPDHRVHLAIVTEGSVRVAVAAGKARRFARGDAFLVPRGLGYLITSDGDAVLFKASVPH